MAVSATVEKIQGKLLLTKSTDPQTGAITTATVSMPTLSTTATAEQIFTVGKLASRCLEKPLYTINQVVTSNLANE